MHREFDPAAEPFDRPSHTRLYLFTAVVGGLPLAALGPRVADWLAGLALALPAWRPRELFGYRLALVAAAVGGARAFFTSLEGLLFAGRVGADLAIAVACFAAVR